MKTNRTIKRLLYANVVDMGGMPVRQPFPTMHVEQVNPFILLHHAEVKVPTHIPVEKAGIGPHPHRGFSPVTFIFKGGVHHRDSRGNDSIIYEGGVQWMDAGMGIVHSERPPHDIFERGGVQEIIQLWVNLPASQKLKEPRYVPAAKEDMPVFYLDEGRTELRLVAGNWDDKKGPIQPVTPVFAAMFWAKPGEYIEIPVQEAHEGFLYLLHGQATVDGFGLVDEKYVAELGDSGNTLRVKFLQESTGILLTGEPIREPLVSYGPFVMNTETEIMVAMRDYQMGKMGILIED